VRERLATLPLDDTDIVGVVPARLSVPPPPPSHVAPVGSRASMPPPQALTPPKVPTLEIDAGWDDDVSPAAVSIPPPAPPKARTPRVTMSDPTDILFDGIYGLTFARGAAEAAEMCAQTLAKALAARSVVIHTHDLSTGELRAIGAHGDGDFEILGSAEASEDDLVASAVLCNGKSVTMTFDGELPRMAPKRLRAVGAPRKVVAAPAIAWGRCLAIVEVIDAAEAYEARVADAATYVADHLAQFLSARAA